MTRLSAIRKFFGIRVGVVVCVFAALAMLGAGAVRGQTGYGPYEKQSGVSGTIGFIGSDTLINLMTLWGEGFGKFYPNVRVQGEGKGSSTAPPALIEGTAQLGPMSRPMKSTEIDAFEKEFGYRPLEVRVALDALAVYVNKDNPIEGMTLPEVDAVFSETRKGGYPTDVREWGQLGVDQWASKPISLYGRNSASGTYGFFKENALFKGDYKDTVKEQPGSASVVQGVDKDPYGIGYSGLGYSTSGVRRVPLAMEDGEEHFEANVDNVISGDYPLSRFLYVYVNRQPGNGLDPLVLEFLSYVLSEEGQQQVEKDGFIPMPRQLAEQELGKLTE